MFVTKLIENADKDIDFTGMKPFVFRPSGKPKSHIEETGEEILASPFPFFSIEVEGKYISDTNGIGIACITCLELAPDDYKFSFMGTTEGRYVVVNVKKGEEVYLSILAMVKLFLDRLHDEKKGLINGGSHARYKDSQGQKQSFKTNDIIYVARTLNANSQTIGGQKIRHIKGWTVRSHWRKIAGKGIDRLGERTVEGYTWIPSHVKGDEKMLNNKVRKV